METDDILTDDMHVSRPVFAEVFALYFLVGVVTEGDLAKLLIRIGG